MTATHEQTTNPTSSDSNTAPRGATVTTKIKNTIPYKGDDLPQTMAKNMAWPMLGMGSMSVVVGFIIGIIGGTNFGDAFSPSGVASDLSTGQTLGQLSGAFVFLGMGMILGAITMTLVNIVRTLRDAGRDVQTSLGAEAIQIKKPWSGVATAPMMMMGLMVEIAAFIIGIVNAVTLGGVDPSAVASPSGASASDLADIGTVNAFSAWLPGLRLTGLAMILVAIVFVLTTIQQVIRFQGDRVSELAA